MNVCWVISGTICWAASVEQTQMRRIFIAVSIVEFIIELPIQVTFCSLSLKISSG